VKQFKGWTIPGPQVPGGVEADPGETLDASSGHFRLFQLREGHRFSTDDLLVAGYAASGAPQATRILDLGSGIGSVASVLAWKFPLSRLTTIEAQPESVRLARKSWRYNGCEERVDVRLGDFRDPLILRPEERFDLISGSPPYFPLGAGIHGDHPQKIACRFEVRGDLADYALVAREHLAPGGAYAFVFPVDPPHQQERVMRALVHAQLKLIRARDVVLKQGHAPLLGVFLCALREDLPETSEPFIEPALVIRDAQGRITPEYQAFKLAIGFPP
jgi:tRNA1Val (adenine37-N6)-methyltransferase